MRNYETVFILDPTVGDERIAEEIEKARSVIESLKGEVIDVQRWGKRKLAYEIKKRREGYYTVMKFKAEATAVAELERNFRLSEPIIRFMTVVDQSPPQAQAMPQDSAEAATTETAAGESPESTQPEIGEKAVEAGASRQEEAGPETPAAPEADGEKAEER